jgi:hypothetical protein
MGGFWNGSFRDGLVSSLANNDYYLPYQVICRKDHWGGATNQAIKG